MRKRPLRKKNKGGRPRVSDAEKIRRGTWINRKREKRPSAADLTVEPAPIARDYVGIMRCYMADVASGAVVACQWVQLACARQARDLDRGDPGYVWSPAHVTAACRF